MRKLAKDDNVVFSSCGRLIVLVEVELLPLAFVLTDTSRLHLLAARMKGFSCCNNACVRNSLKDFGAVFVCKSMTRRSAERLSLFTGPFFGQDHEYEDFIVVDS